MLADRITTLRRQFGGSAVTTATRLIDLPCRYGMHLLIAIRLPLAEVGAFYVVFGTMMVASGLGRIGIDRAATREVARLLAQDETAAARATMARAAVTVTLLSLLLTVATMLLAWPAAHYVMRQPEMVPLFILGALSILPQNLANLVAGSLAGLHRVTQSQIIYTWLWPGLFCLLALPFQMSVAHALIAVAVAMALATAIGAVMLLRDLPARHGDGTTAATGSLVPTGLSLFSAELVQLLISAAPPVALGALASTSEAGLYAIAWRVVLIIYMFVSSIGSITAPRFARYYVLEDHFRLKREAGRAIGFALALSVLPILLVTIEPARILMLFGAKFEPAAAALRWLLIGQLAATLTTTTPELLGMTGYARSLLRINAVSFVVLLGGLVLFVPGMGAQGAALATSLTMIVNAAGTTLACRRLLGFVPLGALYDQVRGARAHQAAASATPD